MWLHRKDGKKLYMVLFSELRVRDYFLLLYVLGILKELVLCWH